MDKDIKDIEKALLEDERISRFLQGLMDASEEELSSVDGVGDILAKNLVAFFNKLSCRIALSIKVININVR